MGIPHETAAQNDKNGLQGTEMTDSHVFLANVVRSSILLSIGTDPEFISG